MAAHLSHHAFIWALLLSCAASSTPAHRTTAAMRARPACGFTLCLHARQAQANDVNCSARVAVAVANLHPWGRISSDVAM